MCDEYSEIKSQQKNSNIYIQNKELSEQQK